MDDKILRFDDSTGWILVCVNNDLAFHKVLMRYNKGT